VGSRVITHGKPSAAITPDQATAAVAESWMAAKTRPTARWQARRVEGRRTRRRVARRVGAMRRPATSLSLPVRTEGRSPLPLRR